MLKINPTSSSAYGSSNAIKLCEGGGSPITANSTTPSCVSFYPDGTSSGGEVQVADTRDEFVRITIRALTGGVLVSPIERKGRL